MKKKQGLIRGVIMSTTVKKILDTARSFLGYSEFNGKHKEILEIYNNHKPLARGYKMTPSDSWCDCFVSAVAIKSNAVDIIGTEVGCERHIDIFKEKGIWIEDGTTKPKAGDIILFNWDKSSQPNDGFADHIGFVEKVENGYITSIEGNKHGEVARRKMPLKWGYIRGFARPKYESEEKVKEIKEITPTLVILEFGVADGCETPIGGRLDEHATMVCQVVKNTQKQDFRIVSLPVSSAYEWIKDNIDDVFVITISVGNFGSSYEYKEFKDKIYMCTSAGNDGADGEGILASKDYFTAIGAVDDDYKFENYSSYGKGFVEFAGIVTKQNTKYTFDGKEHTKHLRGTSFASPQHATEVMNLMVDYFTHTGEKLEIDEVLRIRNKYVKDVLEDGKDLKSGYGVYEYKEEHIRHEIDYIELKKRVKVLEELNKVYNTIEEVPNWAKGTVAKVIAKGHLKGTNKGLNLNTVMLRMIKLLDRVNIWG